MTASTRVRDAAFALTVGLVALAATPARAELAVFADGAFLKVSRYAVEGDAVRLELPSGGAMRVPLLRVERIVEDEVVPVADEPVSPPSQPRFPLRFDPLFPRPETPYGELIQVAAEKHGLNPALIAAVARAESAFAPTARSHKGARGLMQLMPATAARFGLGLAWIDEPALNLDAGARYLRWLADRFDDDLLRVLAAYNAGEGAVERYDGVPPYRETRGYVARIFSALGLPSPWDAPAATPAPVSTTVVAAGR